MFNFLKKKSKEKEILGGDKKEKESFALYMIFPSSFVIDKEKITKRINSIDNSVVNFDMMYDLDGKDGLYFNITINEDKFRVVGIDSKLPKDICDYTINCSYGNKDELDNMKKHNYHIIAFYEGRSIDMNHILNTYFKLAYGFLEHNLLGLINGYSWNGLIPSLIQAMGEESGERGLANTPAMMVWRNFVKIPHNDGVWFVTKGNNLYGICEYAYYGTFEETEEVYEMFENIFNYQYESGAKIIAGHTIQIEDEIYLKFKEVYELEDILNGENIGTLVLEKITENEINNDL